MHFPSPGLVARCCSPSRLLAAAYVVLQLRRKKYVARFSNLELLGSVAPRRPGLAPAPHLRPAAGRADRPDASASRAHRRRPRPARPGHGDDGDRRVAVDGGHRRAARRGSHAAKPAAKTFVDLLPTRINLGLVAFGGNASVARPAEHRSRRGEGRDRQPAAAGLHRDRRGGVHLLDAINVVQPGHHRQGRHSRRRRRIVLLSDGANNKGRSVEPAAAAADRRQACRSRPSRSAPTPARSPTRARRSPCRPTSRR